MALVTSHSRLSFVSARKDRDYWGRLVESAVGAHLLNGAEGTEVEIYYWRDRGHEVDFVLHSGERIVSVEVKSGRARSDDSGMDAFAKNFQPFRLDMALTPTGEFTFQCVVPESWIQRHFLDQRPHNRLKF